MSKEIVREYIENERKHLVENIYKFNNLEEWVSYAKTHIYYHLIVVIDNESVANEVIENIWDELNEDDDDEEE